MNLMSRVVYCTVVLSTLMISLTRTVIAETDPLLVSAPVALTVETDSSRVLDIIAANGRALTKCRPYLASRAVGASAWEEEYSTYQVRSAKDEELVLEASFAKAKAVVTVRRDGAGRQEFSGQLENTSSEPIEVARFHYLDGLIADPSTKLLSLKQFEKRAGGIIEPSAELPPPREISEDRWTRFGVHWPRLPDPIHDRPNTGTSMDAGMLGEDWNSAGFFFGFTGPGTAFGQIGIRTAEKPLSFFAGVLLDGVRLDPGSSRPLEKMLVSFGDLQDELRHWATATRRELAPDTAVSPHPLVGYCSWYQKAKNIQPDDIRRALSGFSGFEAPPGGHTIQIDDGFQVSPGDWSRRDAWRTELPKLAAEIEAKGFIPGIWIAPTAIHASHPIVKEHPEWLQRDADGEFSVRFGNWKNFNGMTDGQTYFLDPDHPGAREFIAQTLRDLRSQGWRYFKIDFAYVASANRAKHDPYKTSYETLRDQWRIFREALGPDVLINACTGGLFRYQLGQVEIGRIGGDIGPEMPKIRRNLAELLLRLHVNGIWFQADPDVFYMRKEKSSIGFEQSHLLTGTQGLLGTVFITSDFADQWSAPSADVVKNYWNKTGPRMPVAQRLVMTPEGLPAAVAVADENGEIKVGLYNWDTKPRDISIPLEQLRIPTSPSRRARLGSIGTEKVELKNGIITVHAQPAESLRIVTLTTEAKRPDPHQ